MKIKIFLSVMAGFILGVGAMWLVVNQTTEKELASLYLTGVMDQANVALHIREGKQRELLARIETALPGYVLSVDREFGGHADSTSAMWMVRAYYERNEIAIPPEIKGILDRLPSEPPTACRIRLRALDNASNSITTETEKQQEDR